MTTTDSLAAHDPEMSRLTVSQYEKGTLEPMHATPIAVFVYQDKQALLHFVDAWRAIQTPPGNPARAAEVLIALARDCTPIESNPQGATIEPDLPTMLAAEEFRIEVNIQLPS